MYAYGDATWYGSAAKSGATGAVDFWPTPSGKGYWIVTEQGRVLAFGDAVQKGGMSDLGVKWKQPAVAVRRHARRPRLPRPVGRRRRLLVRGGAVLREPGRERSRRPRPRPGRPVAGCLLSVSLQAGRRPSRARGSAPYASPPWIGGASSRCSASVAPPSAVGWPGRPSRSKASAASTQAAQEDGTYAAGPLGLQRVLWSADTDQPRGGHHLRRRAHARVHAAWPSTSWPPPGCRPRSS